MFIEYKEGEKHGGTPSKADMAESPDAFRDCGQLIGEDEVVIDVDDVPKDVLKEMIKEFKISTETVWTDRGVHLWYKKPVSFGKRRDGVCRLGFKIEQHTKQSNPAGMTIKRNGVLRIIENQGKRQYMPDFFKVGTARHPYQNLLGMQEGDGRNQALFTHRAALKNCQGWETILKFINQHVFAEPMSDDELSGVMREMDTGQSDEAEEYVVAQQILANYRIVMYSAELWWFNGTEYISDPDNNRLKKMVYQICEGKTTRFVDEVIKQIAYRCKLVPDNEVFSIRFRNGILRRGEFVPIDNYTDFTPFFIDIDYKPDAPAVPMVDKYIDELTDHDPDYRNLLAEVIGYVMITDPERIRSLGKFFMFRGDGANGKGTLLQIMMRIYNAKNCTNLSIKQLVDDRFRVTMIGKLANLGDDIEAEAINEEQLKVLKNISTADTVNTRHLYKESVPATFTVKLYFTTNSDIKSFEKGYAYKRRIVWLPMFNKIEKPDPDFISKITTPEALQYWIRYIVDGYKRLYKNRAWTKCHIVEEYNDEYHEDNNVSLQFAKDLDPDTEIQGRTVNDLREAFLDWSSDDRKFSAKLFQDAVWDLYKMGLGVKKIGGKSRRVFMKQSETTQKLHN